MGKPFTIVTQFITSDNTDEGDLIEIRREYVQGGKRISSPKLDINEKDYDSISAGFCTEQKKETGDPDEQVLVLRADHVIHRQGTTTKFPPAPPTPPAPTPSPPGPSPSPSSGQCCYGGCAGSCQGGWCGESQSQCEGSCNGQWCPKGIELVV